MTPLARFLWLAMLMHSAVEAGFVRFDITFNNNEVAVVNTGTSAVYQVTAWTLGPSSLWQPVSWSAGNPAWLPPQSSIQGQRPFPQPVSQLGRYDPLMLVFFDEAGSRFAHLAWRKAPAFTSTPLTVRRNGRTLTLSRPRDGTVVTHALMLPDDGIARLTRFWMPSSPPPEPQHHVWSRGAASWILDTGTGQRGVWLVHEHAGLQLQVVTDAWPAGQEQQPWWLLWCREHLLKLSAVVVLVGMALMLCGHRRSPRGLA